MTLASTLMTSRYPNAAAVVLILYNSEKRNRLNLRNYTIRKFGMPIARDNRFLGGSSTLGRFVKNVVRVLVSFPCSLLGGFLMHR